MIISLFVKKMGNVRGSEPENHGMVYRWRLPAARDMEVSASCLLPSC